MMIYNGHHFYEMELPECFNGMTIYNGRLFLEMELPECFNGMTLLFDGPFNDDGVSHYRVYYSYGLIIKCIARVPCLPVSFDELISNNEDFYDFLLSILSE